MKRLKNNLENIPDSNIREPKLEENKNKADNQDLFEFHAPITGNSKSFKQVNRVSSNEFSPTIKLRKGVNSSYNERMTTIDTQAHYFGGPHRMNDTKLIKTNSANLGIYQSLGANNYAQGVQYNNQSYTFNHINNQSFSQVQPAWDVVYDDQRTSHHSYTHPLPYSDFEREAYSPDAINRNRLEFSEYRRLSSNEAIYQNNWFSDYTANRLNQPIYSHSSGMNSSKHEFKLNLIWDGSQSSNQGQTSSNLGDDYEYRLTREFEDLSLASDGTQQNIFEKSSQYAKDQLGWRFLQKKIDEGDPETFEAIYKNILPNFVDLMNNSFGNYLCQKITEKWSKEKIKEIIQVIEKDIVDVCRNSHGTRAVQRIIEYAQDQELIDIIINLLKDHVKDLVEDINGNHAIQKALVAFSPVNNQFIFDKMIEQCQEIAWDKHGWCVMQKCILNGTQFQKDWLVNEIISNTKDFVRNPYGNYVIQYVLNLKNLDYNSKIGEHLLGSIIELSKWYF